MSVSRGDIGVRGIMSASNVMNSSGRGPCSVGRMQTIGSRSEPCALELRGRESDTVSREGDIANRLDCISGSRSVSVNRGHGVMTVSTKIARPPAHHKSLVNCYQILYMGGKEFYR